VRGGGETETVERQRHTVGRQRDPFWHIAKKGIERVERILHALLVAAHRLTTMLTSDSSSEKARSLRRRIPPADTFMLSCR